MKKILYTSLIFFFLISISAKSQDTIQMLNGEKLLVKVRDLNPASNLIVVEFTKKNKVKSKAIQLTDVYNIHFFDGTTKPVYKMDTLEGFNLTYDEAGKFVQGQQFAMKNYKAPWITATSAVIGAASPLALQFFYGLIVPTVYTGTMGLTKPCMKKWDNKYPELFNDKYFKSGFVKQARKKRVMNAVYGSLIGIGVSAITTGVIVYVRNK
jgi:hypothetical protein